jgi:DNA-binding MarR family transcriptional regulator
VTRIYDHYLAPAGLTANQGGLLAHLYGASRPPSSGLSIGALAKRVGMGATTLNRNLKPLAAQDLVKVTVDLEDARVRALLITQKGIARLQKAVPSGDAQTHLANALGTERCTRSTDRSICLPPN